MNKTEKITELKDIYTPLFESIVVEFIIPSKTKAGVHLLEGSQAAKEQQTKVNPCLKVIAIGEGVKNIKVGDWILPSVNMRPHQIPLIYKNAKEGTQHGQIHVSEVLGKVDPDFAQLQTLNEEKEKIIN